MVCENSLEYFYKHLKFKVMVNINNRYTEKDDNIIIEFIKNNPDNIKKAIILASKELNRTEASIYNRWYTKLKNTKEVFTLVSDNKVISNTKVLRNKESKEDSINNLIKNNEGYISFDEAFIILKSFIVKRIKDEAETKIKALI